MTLSSGTRLGPYDIVSAIGADGMGVPPSPRHPPRPRCGDQGVNRS